MPDVNGVCSNCDVALVVFLLFEMRQKLSRRVSEMRKQLRPPSKENLKVLEELITEAEVHLWGPQRRARQQCGHCRLV